MELHSAQYSILRTLRHTPSARYTDLRMPTGLESDAFKFHIQRLTALKYVHKLASGQYELTAEGKELANNLSKQHSRTQKQPKLSVAITASRTIDGTTTYLFQQRLRNPYYGFWGSITGPVQWGEQFETTAQREFEKQTGMTAHYTVQGFCRKTDYVTTSDVLLEDKLFVVITATDIQGDITNEWQKGCNAWMTIDELQHQEKYFASTINLIEITQNTRRYGTITGHYTADEY
jgi:ADP-ribose pyrophosphatase YjhB (NUDIX family)/predicted transcriptional regulator